MKITIIISFALALLFSQAYAKETQSLTTLSTAKGKQVMQPSTTKPTPPMTGEAFLEANKKKPGVITLPDGLQYKILVEGNGTHPTEADTVTVNYAGTLINGKEFDSSYKRGQPASFPVGMVIPGWTEALKLMKVGSVWELFIPPKLAYGERGAPPSIGPNETLIFKVELLEINK
jgi:FKBP-type peptidyl-prolyl cis-trans isomerase FklB